MRTRRQALREPFSDAGRDPLRDAARNAISDAARDAVTSRTLTYRQQLHRLALLGEALLGYPKLPAEAEALATASNCHNPLRRLLRVPARLPRRLSLRREPDDADAHG